MYGKIKRGTRGQITLFVILALIVMIMVGLAIYYTTKAKESGFTKPNIDVDEKFAPIQNYVEQCMNQLLVDGVVKIGQHGGYVDPRDGYVTGRVINLNPIAPYDSEAMFLSTVDINSSVVYWVHGVKSADCDNCVLTSEAPTITEMENQLSRYLQKHLSICINDYEVFNNQGFLALDSKNYTVKTSISDSGVAAILETDVYVKINNDEGKLNIFYTETDLPLKKYYELALVITASEIDTNFLENMG
ncbi:MAG TPA: Tad domain-containing protein, partial [Allocoleopsis sp.]